MTDQETQLWNAFRNGKKEAFEELLNTYYDAMFNYGTKFCKNHDELSDNLHDLMLHLWERRTFLNETENLKMYLFKALRNHIFKKNEKSHFFTSLDETQSYNQYYDNNVGESNILQNEIVEESSSRIKYVMQKLTKRQQEVLHLRFYENLSNEEIASLLNISRPAAANLLSESIKKFRSHWQIEFTLILFFISLIYSML